MGQNVNTETLSMPAPIIFSHRALDHCSQSGFFSNFMPIMISIRKL